MNVLRLRDTVLSVFVGLTLLLVSSGLSHPVLAAPGINEQIPFTGTLKNSSDTLLSGTFDMVFRIYDASSGGSVLWTGTHSAGNGNPVTVSNGIFQVLLGSGSGNALNLDFNDDAYYLGISIEADPEMTPRTRLGAAGYAFNADRLDGFTSGDFIQASTTGRVEAASAVTLFRVTQNGAGNIVDFYDGGSAVFTVADGGLTTVTDLYNQGAYQDVTNSAGSAGYVLQSTGTSTVWVATSTLGFTGGGGSSLFTDSGATTYLTAVGDNLGVGTTTASAKLTVAGDVLSTGLVTGSRVHTTGSATSTFSGGVAVAETEGLSFTLPGDDGVFLRQDSGTFGYGDLAISRKDDPTQLVNLAFVSGGSISANSGISGGGNYTPSLSLNTNGSVQLANTTQGSAANRVFQVNLTTGMEVTTGGLRVLAGNVGVGTSSPAQEFSVAGDVLVTGALYDNANSAGTNGMVLQSDGSGFNWVATSTLGLGGGGASTLSALTDTSVGTAANGDLLVYNGSQWVDRATSSLGINTDDVTEGSNLFFTNARADARINATTSISNITTLSNLASIGTVSTGVWQGSIINDSYLDTDVIINQDLDTSDELLTFLVDETGSGLAVFSISPTVSSPTILGTLDARTVTIASGTTHTGSASNIALGSNFLSGDGQDEGISIDGSGSVGIGTTSPTAQLQTTGTLRFSNFGAGTLQTDAVGNVSVSSDERLKQLQGAFAVGLEDILLIDPITYKWDESSGFETETVYAGFSAQNVKKAIPEAVGIDKNGFLTLSDRPIIAGLINANKEAQKQLHELLSTGETDINDELSNLSDGNEDTVWEKVVALAKGFKNGALSIVGLNAEYVYTNEIETDLLCVGDACVDEDTFLEMIEAAQQDSVATPASTPAVSESEPEQDDTDSVEVTEEADTNEGAALEETSPEQESETSAESDEKPELESETEEVVMEISEPETESEPEGTEPEPEISSSE